MFELPEFVTLSRQVNDCLVGKRCSLPAWATRPISLSGTTAPRRSSPAWLPERPLDHRTRAANGFLSPCNPVIFCCLVSAGGGCSEEFDLFNRPGGYQRIMGKNAVGRPCPRCSQTVEKFQYLGGACYYCPACQV